MNVNITNSDANADGKIDIGDVIRGRNITAPFGLANPAGFANPAGTVRKQEKVSISASSPVFAHLCS